MNKLSGLVLDAADDTNGEVLRAVYPTLEELPELIKSAEYVGRIEQQSLPDDLFALVSVDQDSCERKYACATAGDTALSVLYFLSNAHKLPEDAQVKTAQNLQHACGWYGLTPPEELNKVAMGVGSMIHLGLMGPEAVKGAKTGIKNKRGIAQQSGSIINPAILGGQASRGM